MDEGKIIALLNLVVIPEDTGYNPSIIMSSGFDLLSEETKKTLTDHWLSLLTKYRESLDTGILPPEYVKFNSSIVH